MWEPHPDHDGNHGWAPGTEGSLELGQCRAVVSVGGLLWHRGDRAQEPDSASSRFPFIAKPQFFISKMGLMMVFILQGCCEGR